uniref:Aprataxin and PNK-like factor PBZ domain-containing protein n=1 Tax=Anopheles farauti TaxID=69004 RepID=A0A182Q0N0_9DIPT
MIVGARKMQTQEPEERAAKEPGSPATEESEEELMNPVLVPREPTHAEPLSITFPELLDKSLGELEYSLQTTFLIDPEWVLYQYAFAGYAQTPLLLLYGENVLEQDAVSCGFDTMPHVTALKIDMKHDYGLHHTKMGLYAYRDGSMRVVIATANLLPREWHYLTQGLWVSPTLPAVAEDAPAMYGESVTGFRRSLLTYLNAYDLPELEAWQARIRKTDFTGVKVFLVASVPGEHSNLRTGPIWGHPRLGFLLSLHSAPIDDSCPLVAQCSGVGSYGPKPESWVLGEIMRSFRKDSAPSCPRQNPTFCLIYPSHANVLQFNGGGMYSKEVHNRQRWLTQYLYQWSCHTRHRNTAMSHIKTYCRWSHEGLYWFLLTSANFSKSAWVVTWKNNPLRIYNYEAGVLFMPNIMLNEDVFPMHPNGKHPPFPMPYDVPLVPYGPDDEPYLYDLDLDESDTDEGEAQTDKSS